MLRVLSLPTRMVSLAVNVISTCEPSSSTSLTSPTLRPASRTSSPVAIPAASANRAW